MTYTAKERKEIHSQLVAAKQYLWDGKGKEPACDMQSLQTHICIAISRTQGLYHYDGGSELLACKMIAERLGGSFIYLDGWLEDVAKVPKAQLTHLALQTYRHEWLDHLIKEYSNNS